MTGSTTLMVHRWMGYCVWYSEEDLAGTSCFQSPLYSIKM